MDYITLFPSASRSLPRFSAIAAAILSQAEDLIDVIQSLNAAFSVSEAVGVQLDALGNSLRVPRPDGMSDADYRKVLSVRLSIWNWDGANDTAQTLLTENFPGSTICDNLNGTVTIHVVSALQRDQALYPLPAGVKATITE